MVHIISDVHGCYDTLMELMKKLPKNSIKVFVGDLIDRGPKSKEVVNYIIENNFICIKGNHEEMFINELFNINLGSWGEKSWWQKKIRSSTLYSYNYDLNLLSEHREFFKKLPIYIEFPDITNENGDFLVVSHSSVSSHLNRYKGLLKISDNKKDKNLLEEISDIEDFFSWNKDIKIISGINNNYYNVFGHITIPFSDIDDRNKIVNDIYIDNLNKFACIDSGRVYGKSLTALEFPSMKIYQQKNIENKI